MPELTTFREQINIAQHQAMKDDPTMLSFGLGISDPKAIFGTTAGLAEAFGPQRVFDMPTAENGMTGIGVGAALSGSRVLMSHQRTDFFLLAMDQLVNNAAKWHYMFNGQMKVPLTIRIVVGRGWGQGPTHAQNLQAWFAHIPGLKVVVPSCADAAASQLYGAIMDDNPVLFIEHRWLHEQQCVRKHLHDIKEKPDAVRVHRQGDDCTIIANSYMLLEALVAADYLAKQGISVEVLETVHLAPENWQEIYCSVNKTSRAIICDSAHKHFSVAAELSSCIVENCFSQLTAPPVRLALPGYPEPTSYFMTKSYYQNARNIIGNVATLLGRNIQVEDDFQASSHHDIPGTWFNGPF